MNEKRPTMADAAEMLWGVVANVSGGDWTKQNAEWQQAAARWRDYYFAAARSAVAPASGEVAEPAPPASTEGAPAAGSREAQLRAAADALAAAAANVNLCRKHEVTRFDMECDWEILESELAAYHTIVALSVSEPQA